MPDDDGSRARLPPALQRLVQKARAARVGRRGRRGANWTERKPALDADPPGDQPRGDRP